jgi:alpha-tubulin suppressor-like RCC1 family protein
VATLTVVLAPMITQQPVSQGAALGSTVNFQSAALGSGSVAWQWYFGTNALAGATSPQLTISNVRTSNFGNYWAVATNSYGSATSAVATLSFSPVICWGQNDRGQTLVPPSATNVVGLAAGDYHLVALRGDGTVLAWGASNYNNGFVPDLIQVPPDATNVVGIAAGSAHTLAVRTNNTVLLWGYILGSATNSFVPADLTNVAAQALGPGAQHALSLLTDGTVRDWGNAGYGLTNIPPTATNVVSVSAGAYHSVALRADGTVIAWGDNSAGQTYVPASVSNVVAISSGWRHNLALRADGSLVQWGGAYVYPSPGSLPAAATNIVAFACGGVHSLALRRDGKLFAWGDDTEGQINLPAWATNLAAVAGGSYNSLALVADGPAQLTSPLLNRSVPIGGKAFFRATAVGVGPLSYQWQFNGTNMAGATNAVLVISNAQPFQAGAYSVVVSNALGASTSPGALLTVVPNPSLILTSSLTVLNGQVNFLAASPTGLVWAVQGSANLLDWTDLATLTNSTGTMAFTGVLPDSVPSFYRLRFVRYTGF